MSAGPRGCDGIPERMSSCKYNRPRKSDTNRGRLLNNSPGGTTEAAAESKHPEVWLHGSHIFEICLRTDRHTVGETDSLIAVLK